MAKPVKKTQHSPAERLLIVMPVTLGQMVMATPTLRAFRQLYPDAHITALVRRHLRPIIDGCPWVNRIVSSRQKHRGAPKIKRTGPIKLAARLASGRFDTAVLMPEGLRAALLVRLAGIPRRVGYDRNARGSVLTDRLLPRRVKGDYVPVPTREQYLGLARYLGAIDPDPTMRLFTRPSDDEQARALSATWGTQSQLNEATGLPMRPLVLLVPGAGSDKPKMWPALRFAELADRLADKHQAVVAIIGSPAERPLLNAVKRQAKTPIVDLLEQGVDLTLLKSVIRQCSLVVTNDTGPRHLAAALGAPLVTLFGEHDRVWTETACEHERHVAVEEGSPATRNGASREPMAGITVDSVFTQAIGAMRDGAMARAAAGTGSQGPGSASSHGAQA